MFSEALKIMDQNTVRFMMDEMQQELSDAKNKLSDTETKLSNTVTKLSDTETKLSDTEKQFIQYIITTSKEQSTSKEETVEKLMSNCHKTQVEAESLIEQYW